MREFKIHKKYFGEKMLRFRVVTVKKKGFVFLQKNYRVGELMRNGVS